MSWQTELFPSAEQSILEVAAILYLVTLSSWAPGLCLAPLSNYWFLSHCHTVLIMMALKYLSTPRRKKSPLCYSFPKTYFAPFTLAMNFRISLLKAIKCSLGRYHFIQVIKVNVTSNGTNPHHVQWDEHNITSVASLPKMLKLNVIMSKHESNPIKGHSTI